MVRQAAYGDGLAAQNSCCRADDATQFDAEASSDSSLPQRAHRVGDAIPLGQRIPEKSPPRDNFVCISYPGLPLSSRVGVSVILPSRSLASGGRSAAQCLPTTPRGARMGSRSPTAGTGHRRHRGRKGLRTSASALALSSVGRNPSSCRIAEIHKVLATGPRTANR
jgi:hypothetical protein